MRDAKLGIRSLITALVLLAIASFNARGDESADFLGHLHDFRVKNYVALDAYYRFSASGDTETLNEIVGAINEANSTMGALTDSTAGVLTSPQVEGLNVEFDKFKELMRQNINDVKQTGYPDLRLLSEMAEQAAVMNDNASSLYRTALESTKITPDKRVEAARSAAVTLAQMMAKYSVRSNSSVTQTFQGTATDEPLDVKAKAMDSLLAETPQGKKHRGAESTSGGHQLEVGVYPDLLHQLQREQRIVCDRPLFPWHSGRPDCHDQPAPVAGLTQLAGRPCSAGSRNPATILIPVSINWPDSF